jgi:hypothetical protein
MPSLARCVTCLYSTSARDSGLPNSNRRRGFLIERGITGKMSDELLPSDTVPSTDRSPIRRFAHAMFASVAVLVTSFSIAICAASPEFIWRGMRIALTQPHWLDLLSALLIGLNLAFFIEPAMRRLHHLIYREASREPAKSNPLDIFFTASLGLAFALASVCLHDAMSAFVSQSGATDIPGLRTPLLLIVDWAIVPFAVALAWQSVKCSLCAIVTGIVAAASPFIAGWLFGWSARDVITTAIPCLLVLALGYRRVPGKSKFRFLARHASIVALVALSWLIAALLVDIGLGVFHAKHLRLYNLSRFFIDLRFYFGWVAGLVFAGIPVRDEPAPDERP